MANPLDPHPDSRTFNGCFRLERSKRPQRTVGDRLWCCLLPKIPGTWGSILALILWYVLLASLELWLVLSVCVVTFLLGWYASHRITSRNRLGDEPQIVVDEIVGMWIALVAIPNTWWIAILAFLVFRFFDIAKPWPIAWVDRHIKGGLGVMLDDVLAGAATWIIIHGLLLLLD